MPTPLAIDGEILRVYYCARDRDNRSHVFYVDIAQTQPHTIVSRPEIPCLLPGSIGCFDTAGVMPTSVIRVGDEVWMYFIGWSVRQDVPYHNGVGIAVSRDGGTTFTRRFSGPIVGTTAAEPFFCSTADVLRTPHGWQMWYASTTEWRVWDGKAEPRYHLKYATSIDGLTWLQNDVVAVDYRDNEEAAVARATVLRHGAGYHMWFCHRDFLRYRVDSAHSYRIGYAVSDNGVVWTRSSAPCIFDPGSAGIDGVDDIMEAYPAVIKFRDRLLMFYNGNGFGQTGILLATAVT